MNAENNLNPTGQRFYLYSQTIIANSTFVGQINRTYLEHTPQIENGQIVGLYACSAISGPNFNNANISGTNYNGSLNIGSNNFLTQLYLTLVNKKGKIIFSQIPIALLFPYNGKIHLYNAVNIDMRKSYLTFAAGSIPANTMNVNLVFIMNFQS